MIGRQLFAPGAKRAAAQLLLNGRSRRGTACIAWRRRLSSFNETKQFQWNQVFFRDPLHTQRKLTLIQNRLPGLIMASSCHCAEGVLFRPIPADSNRISASIHQTFPLSLQNFETRFFPSLRAAPSVCCSSSSTSQRSRARGDTCGLLRCAAGKIEFLWQFSWDNLRQAWMFSYAPL